MESPCLHHIDTRASSAIRSVPVRPDDRASPSVRRRPRRFQKIPFATDKRLSAARPSSSHRSDTAAFSTRRRLRMATFPQRVMLALLLHARSPSRWSTGPDRELRTALGPNHVPLGECSSAVKCKASLKAACTITPRETPSTESTWPGCRWCPNLAGPRVSYSQRSVGSMAQTR